MTKPKGKTPMELYLSAIDTLASENTKYEETKNKNTQTALKRLAKISEIEAKIAELEPIKEQEILSATCESFLIKTYALERYNRVKEIVTKQMYKGIECEDDSINLFCRMEGVIYEKNTKKLKNSFISGTPDLFDGESVENADRIIDIKSSWDIETFLKNIKAPLSQQYYWQLQGYMALSGAKTGTIAYCLVNTPDSIIEGEKFAMLRKMDVVTEEDARYKAEVIKIERNMRFDDIPPEEKILRIEVERNDEDIDKIYRKVEKCRQYLAEFQDKHIFFTKNYRKDRINDIKSALEET